MDGISRTRSCHAIFTLVAVVALLGCGDGLPRRVPVAGKVLIDGEPLSSGNIKFVPEGGRPAVAMIGSDGTFELRCFGEDDGAIVGTHQVSVSSKRFVTNNNVEWYAPSKYSNHRTSGLVVEVSEPIDDLVIELTWEGEKRPRK